MSDISDLQAEVEAVRRFELEDDGVHTYSLTAGDAVAALADQLRRGKEAGAALLRLTDEYARISDEKGRAIERITALEADNEYLNEQIEMFERVVTPRTERAERAEAENAKLREDLDQMGVLVDSLANPPQEIRALRERAALADELAARLDTAEAMVCDDHCGGEWPDCDDRHHGEARSLLARHAATKAADG